MRVLIYAPDPNDGTAYWRVTSPFGALRRLASDLDYQIVPSVSYGQILGCDVLLLQRPFLADHCAAMRTAALLGRPIWCDWDDDIVDVPINNAREPHYRGCRQNVMDLCAAADVVTVSCRALAEKFGQMRPGHAPPVVVPNAIDPSLRLAPPNDDRLPVRRIAWRGGDSHNHDLLRHASSMARVARELEGRALWHFVGQNPSWVADQFPRGSLRVHGFRDVPGYLHFMTELRPDVLAVPLEDTPFNRCKSNISVLEAAWLGAVPVAPSWLEGCDLDGVFTYADDAGFEPALRAAASARDDELRDRSRRLRAAVAKDYSLPHVNMGRLRVLRGLEGLVHCDTDFLRPGSMAALAAAGAA